MINEMKVTKFSSLEEFISWTDSCPKSSMEFNSWNGCDSYEQAVDIARKGVELQRAEKSLHKLEHTRMEMVQVLDVTGSVVNMDAYLSGEPENMIEFPISEDPTKFLNLLIEVGENCNVSSNQLVNKAIAIASIINDLENNGYRIAISVCDLNTFNKSYTTGMPSNYCDRALATVIKIKDYHQSLSLGQLIGCCHASFLRGLIFAHYYGIYKNVGGPPSGKGRSMTGNDVDTILKSFSTPDMIYIPSTEKVYMDLSTVESAVESISKHIIS